MLGKTRSQTLINMSQAFVVESINGLKNSLEEKLNELHKDLSAELLTSINILKSEIIENLVAENKRLSGKCNELEGEVYNLNNELFKLSDKIYNIEILTHDSQQRSRKNNAEITGIPNTVTDDELEKTVLDIFNSFLEDPIIPAEIEACHRLPSKSDVKPTVIRFQNRKRCKEVKSKDSRAAINTLDFTTFNLPEDTQIYVSDHLSPYYKTIAYYCRKLRRNNLIWKIITDDGIIKIKGHNQFKWTKIIHEQTLYDLFPDFNFTE